jgi:hypothetical protein
MAKRLTTNDRGGEPELGYEVSVRDPTLLPADPRYTFPATASMLEATESAHMALSDMAEVRTTVGIMDS